METFYGRNMALTPPVVQINMFYFTETERISLWLLSGLGLNLLCNDKFLFLYPYFEGVEGGGHIGLILSPILSIHNIFLWKRYLKKRLTYGVDIWYTLFRLYVKALICVWADCVKYCYSYIPLCENWA